MKLRAPALCVALTATVLAAEPARLPRENLLLRHDAAGAVDPVRTAADWQQRRAEVVRGMETVMGPGPFASGAAAKRVALDLRVDDHRDPLSELERLERVSRERWAHFRKFLPTRDNPAGITDRAIIDADIEPAAVSKP